MGQFGQGRVLASTSDAAPQRGCNLVFWNQYGTLWSTAARGFAEGT